MLFRGRVINVLNGNKGSYVEGHSVMIDQYGDTYLSDHVTYADDDSELIREDHRLIDSDTLEINASGSWYPVDDINKMITRMNTVGPGSER